MESMQRSGVCGGRWMGRRRMCLLLGLAGCLVLTSRIAAEPRLTFVDLQAKANHKLSDDLHETAGNHLGNVPQGEQKMGETTFRIGEKMIRVRGEHAAEMPEKVEGIKVDAACDRLHILHSTGYGEGEEALTDGTEIGAYVVQYADKSTERIPIVYGEDLRDWWESPERPDVKRATIAWTGTNPAADAIQRKIRLYAIAWTNPHPDKQVAAIDFVSKGTKCDPFLVAMTVEKK